MYAKKFFLMMVAASSLLVAQAQVKTKEQMRAERAAKLQKLKSGEDETSIIFNRQSAFAVRLNTDGYGLFYEHGKYKSLSVTNLWWISLDEYKSPKEERIANTDGFFQVGTPFIYGKINNFYQLKVGIGQQRLIGGKDIKNGVAFSAIYGGGITAGLLKPYYINAADDSTGITDDYKYSAQTDHIFRYGPINGGSGVGKGLNEIKFTPGVFARAALRFDYGAYNELLSALEAGVTAQYYTKEMPVIMDQPGKKFFFNAYVALVFGKRK